MSTSRSNEAEPEEVTFTCWCGVESQWEVAGPPDDRRFRVLSHESAFVCAHWRDVHDAVSDLAEGLDPHERCQIGCGCNPCIGGNGPMSCDSLPRDDLRWAELELESGASGGSLDVVLGDGVRRQAE